MSPATRLTPLSRKGRQRVRLVLPPDFSSPEGHRRHRFPHQGPALVAASLRSDGVEARAVDLELSVWRQPTAVAPAVIEDAARLDRHLAGAPDEELEALADELVDRVGEPDVDVFAISVDRHTQIAVSLLLGVGLKRRHGRPVLVGGGNGPACLRRLTAAGGLGIDFVTGAATPPEIRTVFQAIRDVPRGRREAAIEPLTASIGAAADEWPAPDFGIYDLSLYRRDPFLADGPQAFPRYDGSVGPRLFLPYHFSFDCQYACSFCQRGGKQTVKSMDRVIRDLAELAERHDCRDFMLFDTQINLHAEAFANALLAANLGVHWTDSFRVAPRRPLDILERMARAGCVGLTFGVESASDRMLKKMIKGHTQAKATAIVQDAHALEIFVRVNLLPCFPGETRADHEETVAWVRQLAPAIDDLAPSSFYLAEGSPVGQDPARFGIVLREARTLEGDHKFRKNLGSLAYDEVGGYRWEEREATLRPAEEELLRAWREGRRGAALSQPSQVFALRRDLPTKAEAYAKVRGWGPGRAHDGGMIAPLGPAPSGAAGLGAPPADALEPAGLPAGSARAKAVERARAALGRHGFRIPDPRPEPNRLTLRLEGPKGGAVQVVVERLRPGTPALRTGRRLMVWYRAETPPPGWTSVVVPRLAEELCSKAFEAIADELVDEAPRAALRRYSVLDLVRRGLKPAASWIVPAGEAAPVDEVPAEALSRFGFVQNERADLVPLATPGPAEGLRMRYVGRDAATVERLAAIEERLYAPAGARPRDDERAALHAELGRLLGFPACCAEDFAAHQGSRGGRGDLHAAVDRPGWHLAPIDWRANHVAALQYELPFLIHVPCRPDCAASRALVERTVAALYGEGRAPIEEVLAQGLVVWADDRVAFFEPAGLPEADGTVPLRGWNLERHPELRSGPRSAERRLAADAAGVPDRSVDALRRIDGRLELRAEGRWRALPGVSELAPPIVLLPAR